MTDAEIFKQNILSFPSQLTSAAITTGNFDKLQGADPDGIIIAGMGGSGMPATILKNFAQYAIIKKPVVAWKNFGLPLHYFKNPLYIFVSFSGNTHETLSGFSQVPKDALQAIVAGGGTLLSEAKAKGLPYATFAQGQLQPRQAWGLTLYGVMSVLKAVRPAIPLPDLSKIIQPASLEMKGKELAEHVASGVTFIYTSAALSHIGQIFKIHLNESGKLLASANVFPEINHNELSAFETKPRGISVIIPTTAEEKQESGAELEIVTRVLTEDGVPTYVVEIPGADLMEVTANSIVLAQWLGYYAAMMRGLDPLSIETVNKIKALRKK